MVEGHANLLTRSTDINHSSQIKGKCKIPPRNYHLEETGRFLFDTGRFNPIRNRGQKCDHRSNLGQCLRRDTPPSTNRNLTNGLYTRIHSYPPSCRRNNRARVCVRVRTRARDTGPGSRPTYDIELHYCRGVQAAKNFSLCRPPAILSKSLEQATRRKNRSNFSSSSSSSNRLGRGE